MYIYIYIYTYLDVDIIHIHVFNALPNWPLAPQVFHEFPGHPVILQHGALRKTAFIAGAKVGCRVPSGNLTYITIENHHL